MRGVIWICLHFIHTQTGNGITGRTRVILFVLRTHNIY